MKRTKWTRLARADLARIDDFHAEHDLDYAAFVGRVAIDAGNFLAEFPAAGPVVEGDERKWRVPGTDYVLIYRVKGDDVEILRAYHGRENWRRTS